MSSLVSLEEFAGYLKRDLDECDAYTAKQLVDGATEAVIEYCGWHIAPVLTETVTVDGTGTLIQTLPTMHLVELVSLAERGVDLDVSRVDWSTNGVMEKRWGSGWTSRRRGIIAEITHGFELTPAWVVTLICAMAGRAYVTPAGIAQESSGGESITYASSAAAPPATLTLLPMDRRMLDRIRVPTGP
jgi:hypothetical protein